jgi:hypothetical protein
MDREQYEELELEEQVKIFAGSSIKERGQLILYSQDPARIANSLSSEELYLISRELDMEERCELIKFSGIRHLRFMADIDCWDNDRIDPKGFVSWLDLLRQADEAQLQLWLDETDYEGLIAGLMQFISVLKPEWEYAIDEVIGDRAFFTLDQYYYIMVDEDNFETVKRAFEILFETNRKRYVALLEGLLSEMEYEIEEEAYRNREIRLADAGFPDYESSLKAYQPLSFEAFEAFEKKKLGSASSHKNFFEETKPQYPVLWSMNRLFIDEVLKRLGEIDTELTDAVYEELAWLSNKLIVCHGMDFTSEDKVKWAVERARYVFNFGLASLSDNDPDKAVKLLKTRWLETIFRYALSLLYPLRDRAKQILNTYWGDAQEDFLSFLDTPYDAIFQGLLESMPRCYDFEVGNDPQHLREFTKPEDLERSLRAVLQIEKLHAWLLQHRPKFFKEQLASVEEKMIERTIFEMAANIFIADTVSLKFSEKALKKKVVKQFIEKATLIKDGKVHIKKEARIGFIEKHFPDDEQSLWLSFFGLIYQRLEEELSALDWKKPLAEIEFYYLGLLKVDPKS